MGSHTTADGGSVHVYRVDTEFEFEYRSATGATVATVRFDFEDAQRLLSQLEGVVRYR